MPFKVITTVVTPAATYDLTTLQDCKDELSLTVGVFDAILQRYISGSSVAASQYCNRVFPAEAVSDQFLPLRDESSTWMGGRIVPLQLSRWPVIGPVTVTENSVLLVESTDFVTDTSNGQITRLDAQGVPTWWPTYIITVAYVGGFNPIPDDVEDSIIKMVTRRYAAKGRDPNLKQQNVPGILEQSWWIATGTESGNMSPDITDVLDNYRSVVVA